MYFRAYRFLLSDISRVSGVHRPRLVPNPSVTAHRGHSDFPLLCIQPTGCPHPTTLFIQSSHNDIGP